MAFIEDIVTQLRRLETALNEALLRLQQAQDSEALHDLRVCLRRIRSLLRPLRGCPGATRLDRAAAELGRPTCAGAIFRLAAVNCSPIRSSSTFPRCCTPGRAASAAPHDAPPNTA